MQGNDSLEKLHPLIPLGDTIGDLCFRADSELFQSFSITFSNPELTTPITPLSRWVTI